MLNLARHHLVFVVHHQVPWPSCRSSLASILLVAPVPPFLPSDHQRHRLVLVPMLPPKLLPYEQALIISIPRTPFADLSSIGAIGEEHLEVTREGCEYSGGWMAWCWSQGLGWQARRWSAPPEVDILSNPMTAVLPFCFHFSSDESAVVEVKGVAMRFIIPAMTPQQTLNVAPHLEGLSGCLLVYDISKATSANGLFSWWKAANTAKIPTILVGTHSDLPRQIPPGSVLSPQSPKFFCNSDTES